ncbi:MAG: hypothetical protein ACJ739_03925 [Acidimicrobiales bacterium]
MTSSVDLPRRSRRVAAVLLAAGLVISACGGGDGGSPDESPEHAGPNRTPPPTLRGGVELPAVDPLRLLVGERLAYGEPLPSQQSAADAYLEDPEVASVTARRLYSRDDGHLLGEVLLLSLDGHEVFDQSVLDGFVDGAVGALGDGTTQAITVAGRPVLRSHGPDGTVLGYREGDQLMLVRGTSDPEVGTAVERQLQAIAAGAVGEAQPFTPLVALPIDAAFVPVASVTFEPIPPAEEETPPEPPALPGATAVHGRYGVVAGERRTTAWAYTLDPGTYPRAEAVEPKLRELVAARAGGAEVHATELLGRVVLSANGADGQPSVRAFREKGLVLVLEGAVPAQLDAVITAWLTALA